MDMRLPESGSVIAAIVGGLGHTVADGQDLAVGSVGEAQLVEALAANPPSRERRR